MVYKLFSNCIPIKGYRRSIIVDTQRENYYIIPNGLYEILVNDTFYSIKEIKSKIKCEYHDIIDEYFEYLQNKDLIFSCDINEVKHFPNLDLCWDEPHTIINSIIDVDEYSQHNFKEIFIQLDELLCKHLEIRFFKYVKSTDLYEIIAKTDNKSFQSIDIIMPYNKDFSLFDLNEILDKFKRITSIVIYNSPNIITNKGIENCDNHIFFIKNEIEDKTNCGVIKTSSFSMNLSSFCEAQEFNTCLNRKLCIDTDGNVKNCPSINKCYGKIENIALKDIINKKEFQSYWHISKDQIEVCNLCEYRYICTDCRAYVKVNDNLYSQPLKCNYNPFIAKWEGEKGYIPIENFGFYNTEGKYIVDLEYMKEIDIQEI